MIPKKSYLQRMMSQSETRVSILPVSTYASIYITNLMKQLNRIWRLLGTVFSFAVFGLAGSFMGILVFPLVLIFVRNPATRQRTARRMIGSSFGAFIWMMKVLGVLSYEIQGAENTEGGHNQLIIANHPTLIDVVFLVPLFPMVDCVVKEAVIKNPFMRGVVVPAMYISSDDSGELLNSCVDRLKSGGRLLLFPEGTRSVYGQPLKFKSGASYVAIRSGAEILPITIRCTQPKLLAKHEPWYKVSPDRPFFSIRIQRPVSLGELIPGDLNPRESVNELNRALVRLFEEGAA